MKKESIAKKIRDLPDILEYEEEDISHLSPRSKEILYPKRMEKDFRITVEFGPFKENRYREAVSHAKKSSHYRESGSGKYLRHHAGYTCRDVNDLFRLFNLVEEDPSCSILVNGKEFPYARTLWLPLMWIFLEEKEKN